MLKLENNCSKIVYRCLNKFPTNKFMDFLNSIPSFFDFSGRTKPPKQFKKSEIQLDEKSIEKRALQMMQDSWELTMQQLEDARVEVMQNEQKSQKNK